MRQMIFPAVALLHLAIANPASAQVQPGAPGSVAEECLGIDQAMALALARSPNIQLASAEQLRAQADLRDAKSITRPQVSTFLRTQAGDNNLTGAGVENSAGLRVSQRLFDFGVSGLEKQAARLTLDARALDVVTARNQTALETALAFVSMAEITKRLEITSEREAFFEREQEATRASLALGGATRSDLAEVSARLADAAADRLELEFQRDRFAASLSRQIGEVRQPCSSSFDSLRDARLLGIVDSVEMALANNARIQSASLELEAQEARVRRAKRNRLPAIDVVAIGSYARDNFRNNDFGFRERIGIDVSIPLLSGGRLAADQQRSRASALAQRSEVEQLRREIAESAEISVRRIASLKRQVERRKEVVARQEEQFEAASFEFDEGLRTLPELVEDRLELEQVRLNAVSAEFTLIREIAQLRAILNDLAPDAASASPTKPVYGPVG
ncbi:MAG: TolC family protein [Pseudomonadota bacterium]